MEVKCGQRLRHEPFCAIGVTDLVRFQRCGRVFELAATKWWNLRARPATKHRHQAKANPGPSPRVHRDRALYRLSYKFGWDLPMVLVLLVDHVSRSSERERSSSRLSS